MRGWFKAPYTGIYNFYAIADDYAVVYMNLNPDDDNLNN